MQPKKLPFLTGGNFDKSLSTSKCVLVHFWAAWSQPDKMQEAILQLLNQEINEIEFYLFDVDPEENQHILQRFEVMHTPRLELFVDGRQHKSIIGFHNKKRLKELLLEFLITIKT